MGKAFAVFALLLALPFAVRGKALPSFFHDVAPMRDFYSLRRPVAPAVAPEIDLVDPDPFNGQAGAGASPGGGSSSPPGSFDASTFPGVDDSLKLQACITALGIAFPLGGICHGERLTGNSWSVDPFDAPNPPAAVVLWPPCATISVSVPIKQHNDFSIHGGCQSRSVPNQVGTVFQAKAGTFPTSYSTGTISVGTPGGNEVITGSGTGWTSSNLVPGCAFIAPGGASTTNNTFGIVTSINYSAQTLVLGWGQNNGTGAGAGSAYVTECGVVVQGVGSPASGAAGVMFGMQLDGFGVDCNNIFGAIGILDWYGNQFSTMHQIQMRNCTNIAWDREWQSQQSGPYTDLIIGTGAGCTSGTIPIVIRSPFGIVPFEISRVTIQPTSCTPAVLVDEQTDLVRVNNFDLEGTFTDGIGISGNVTCPIGCPMPPKVVNGGATLQDIHGFNPSAATNLVHINNSLGTPGGIIILGMRKSGGVVNELTDSVNGCVENTTALNYYITNQQGKVSSSSSSINKCTALSNSQAATVQKSESAADANVLTFSPPSQTGSYRIHFVLDVSAASGATLGWTATWKDANGTAQAPANLPFCAVLTGLCAATSGVTSVAGNFGGWFDIDTDNSGTNIVVQLTFSGTSFTAKATATIERLQ
jgi:hypothetical protein